jgi:hypothetical protein
MNIQRSTLACAAALAASMSATYAGPCSSEITQVRDVIDARIHEKLRDVDHPSVGTGPAPHRQPTPESISRAEVNVGQTSPELFDAVHAGMARAVEADRAGDQSACQQALADVKRLLGSPGNQTDGARR